MRVSCLPFICDASHERLIEPWVKLLASNAGAAETGLSVVAVGLSADDCPRKAWARTLIVGGTSNCSRRPEERGK